MSIDPNVIRTEAHTEIGLLIQRDAGILLKRWARRAVAEQPHAQRVHHKALLDHLSDLLHGLGRSLAESEDGATYQHWQPAQIHGEDRWETGWSLPEVVRDYQILRLVIFEYLEEVLDQPPSLRVVMAVGLVLDEAIAASVIRYVASRDEYLRQLEAERAERDKQIQEQLRQQAEILREVDRRKTEFLAILGHELRNPLAPLMNAVQVMELQPAADPAARQLRDIMKRQVQQLARLADNLLDISRIAQNKIELRRQRVALAPIVEQAVQMSVPHLKARNHKLDVSVPQEPLWLEADPTRLVQIVCNLLNNAAKYTEPGGHVWLTVEREGSQAVIRIRDTGIGIPEDKLPHVFELFTQGEWSVDRSQGGMGIGLALVRRLVDLHGGTIEAHSLGLGRGSEFVVRLPALAVEPRAGAARVPSQDKPTAADGAQGCRRILVVDDNVDAAQTLGMLLQFGGHQVEFAFDGPSALTAAEAFRPDAILLDIGLPRIDGYEVARRLRQQAQMARVLLIALTGYGKDDDRRRSLEAGFNAHLVKPIDPELLAVLLANQAAP